jgi:methoxymalonate biosynthesis protein
MMEIAYQFAGFDSQSCGCHGDLPPAAAPDIQRLHLVPERRVPADTLRLIAPDLAAVDVH